MIDHIATQANEEKSPHKSAHFSRHQHQIIFFDDTLEHFFKHAKHRSANNDSAKNNPPTSSNYSPARYKRWIWM